MATLAVQKIIETGLAPTYSSAAALGDTFVNNGKQFIHVKNASAGSITVSCAADVSTIDVQPYGRMTKANISVAIAAGADRFIGPFPVAAFGGTPAIEYTGVTSLTLAVMSL